MRLPVGHANNRIPALSSILRSRDDAIGMVIEKNDLGILKVKQTAGLGVELYPGDGRPGFLGSCKRTDGRYEGQA